MVEGSESRARRIGCSPCGWSGRVRCRPRSCQTQLVMHPNQRVHLRSLLMIDQCHLSTPRPIRRMAPLEKPSVSTPIRWRPSLPHRGRNDAGLGSAGRRDPLYEGAALRSQFDTSQRFQRPNCTRACTGLQKLLQQLFQVSRFVPDIARRRAARATGAALVGSTVASA